MSKVRLLDHCLRLCPFVMVVVFLMVCAGCIPTVQRRFAWSLPYYPTITVQAVDAETGEPIEGAVVLCVWTLTKVLIEKNTEVYKVAEAVSGKDGRFQIGGCCWRSDVDAPELTIYKRGYVAWNNITSFMKVGYKRDFAWKNGFVAKMEKWKDGYSFIEHESFISMRALSQTRNFIKAYEWETGRRVEETKRFFRESGKEEMRR